MAVLVLIVLPAGGQTARLASLHDNIVLIGPSGGHSHVIAMAANGSGQRRITPKQYPAEVLAKPPTEFSPAPSVLPDSFAVSPDGMTVVFSSETRGRERKDVEGELFSVSHDGSGFRRITRTPGLWEQMPVFSPDGQKIAYVQDSGVAFAAQANLSIAVMDSDGANARTVARIGSRVALSASAVQIAWHPNSRLLMYTVDLASAFGAVVDLTSGTARPVYGRYAEFSPDGSRIAQLGSSDSTNANIYVGTIEQLSKRTFARSTRPILKSQPGLIPVDFVFLKSGTLLYTAVDARSPRRCHEDLSQQTLGLIERSGRSRVLARKVCYGGRLTAAPSGEAFLMAGGFRMIVSSTRTWQPSTPWRVIRTLAAWGYTPTSVGRE